MKSFFSQSHTFFRKGAILFLIIALFSVSNRVFSQAMTVKPWDKVILDLNDADKKELMKYASEIFPSAYINESNKVNIYTEENEDVVTVFCNINHISTLLSNKTKYSKAKFLMLKIENDSYKNIKNLDAALFRDFSELKYIIYQFSFNPKDLPTVMNADKKMVFAYLISIPL